MGGRGRDFLTGNAGADRFSGGPGDDALFLGGDGRDRASCGAGRDLLLDSRARDFVLWDCDSAVFRFPSGRGNTVTVSPYPEPTRLRFGNVRCAVRERRGRRSDPHRRRDPSTTSLRSSLAARPKPHRERSPGPLRRGVRSGSARRGASRSERPRAPARVTTARRARGHRPPRPRSAEGRLDHSTQAPCASG